MADSVSPREHSFLSNEFFINVYKYLKLFVFIIILIWIVYLSLRTHQGSHEDSLKLLLNLASQTFTPHYRSDSDIPTTHNSSLPALFAV